MSAGLLDNRPKVSGARGLVEGEGGERVWAPGHDGGHDQDRPGGLRRGQQVTHEPIPVTVTITQVMLQTVGGAPG